MCAKAGTCEFFFCPQYSEKNKQILRQAFLCIGAALETDTGLSNIFRNFPDVAADVFCLLPHPFSFIIMYMHCASPTKDVKEETEF